MRRQIHRQRREIRDLQRADIPFPEAAATKPAIPATLISARQRAAQDIYIPDLHIDTLNVKARNFR